MTTTHSGAIDQIWGNYQYLTDIANTAIGKFPGLRITSGFRPGDPHHHGRRMAIDIAFPANRNGDLKYKEVGDWIFDTFPDRVAYVIALDKVRDRNGYSGTGTSGKWVPFPGGGHMDHIHVSGEWGAENIEGGTNMTVNIETAIKYMYDLKAKGIRYSMTGSRTGADGTGDCSGTIYQGLRNGGATNAGWVLNTDSMHDWLVKNGFDLIAQNKEWTAKRGDIVIFGKKGASGGAAGHVVIFISNTQIIHCTWKSASANGIYVDNEATTCPYDMGWYVYRQKETKPSPTIKTIDQLAQEVLQGLHGNGDVRKKSLGSNYDAVQKRVDALASSRNKSIDTIAREVINGKWGNGATRISKLKAAGYDPETIRIRVNQLLK